MQKIYVIGFVLLAGLLMGCENNIVGQYRRKDGDIYYINVEDDYKKWIKIDDADSETFKGFDRHIAKDKNHVYYKHKKQEEISDVASFDILDTHYFYDKDNIYCNFKKIENVDRESFEVFKWNGWAKDKNNYYQSCEVLNDESSINLAKEVEKNARIKDRKGLSLWLFGSSIARIKK